MSISATHSPSAKEALQVKPQRSAMRILIFPSLGLSSRTTLITHSMSNLKHEYSSDYTEKTKAVTLRVNSIWFSPIHCYFSRCFPFNFLPELPFLTQFAQISISFHFLIMFLRSLIIIFVPAMVCCAQQLTAIYNNQDVKFEFCTSYVTLHWMFLK